MDNYIRCEANFPFNREKTYGVPPDNKINGAIISENKDAQDLNELDLNELISRIDQLSLNINPYSVSKEIENIKAVFYQKLREELQTDVLSVKKINGAEIKSNTKKTKGLKIFYYSCFFVYQYFLLTLSYFTKC